MNKLIQTKKQIYPPSSRLDCYLRDFGRAYRSPLAYDQLLEFSDSIALYDEYGDDTLWSTVTFERRIKDQIESDLLSMYAFMRTDGEMSATKYLVVDRIDLCLYGNIIYYI